MKDITNIIFDLKSIPAPGFGCDPGSPLYCIERKMRNIRISLVISVILLLLGIRLFSMAVDKIVEARHQLELAMSANLYEAAFNLGLFSFAALLTAVHIFERYIPSKHEILIYNSKTGGDRPKVGAEPSIPKP